MNTATNLIDDLRLLEAPKFWVGWWLVGFVVLTVALGVFIWRRRLAALGRRRMANSIDFQRQLLGEVLNYWLELAGVRPRLDWSTAKPAVQLGVLEMDQGDRDLNAIRSSGVDALNLVARPVISTRNFLLLEQD